MMGSSEGRQADVDALLAAAAGKSENREIA